MGQRPTWLQQRLQSTPKEPGCYIMKDRAGRVVYVGKAADLRARLGQYFAPNPGDTRFFVKLLDQILGDIDTIVTSNPKEALVLENELIKRHSPRYNVKLRDDKSFLCLRISKRHPWPRLEVIRARNRQPDGAEYFGPYASASALRNTLRVVNRHFGLRTCTDVEFRNRSRPCLEHQIGRCIAPCVLNPSPEDYEARLKHTRLFLQGRSDALVKTLRAEMEQASEALDFELAAHYRDQMHAIERVLERQNVDLKSRRDIDVFGLFRAGADGAVVVLEIRSGVMIGTQAYPLRDVELPDEDVMEDILGNRYAMLPVPDVIVTPVTLTDGDLWAEILGEGRSRKVSVLYPQRGDKRRLLELASNNAKKHFESRVQSAQDNLVILQQIQRHLGLKNLPARIECYDISNIQGTDSVGSMVVAIDGVLAPKSYRHFKIQGEQTPDDYRMMREVLSRRFRGGESRDDLPDLVLIDGGKGQLAVAVNVLSELGLYEVEAAGLAKQRLLDADGHVLRLPKGKGQRPSSDAPERSPERVFRPGRKNPTGLKPNSNGMHLLARLRDEAHRFAITHHRKRRKKRTIISELDGIEGLGATRTKALLKYFGSVKRVKAASIEALSACPKIPAQLAEKIHLHLHGPSA